MANFCKNEDCPPSEELLAFQTGDLPVSESAPVRKHLKVCEFCAAEVEFYEHYPPQAVEKAEDTAIPSPLFQLAEALLNKKKGSSSMERLAKELNAAGRNRK